MLDFFYFTSEQNLTLKKKLLHDVFAKIRHFARPPWSYWNLRFRSRYISKTKILICKLLKY